MTATETSQRPGEPIDYHRWPSLRPPAPVRARRGLAAAAVRRIAEHCGVRVDLPTGGVGPASGPLLVVSDVEAFMARLARHGKIGFAESYMAREWDAPDLVAVMEALVAGVSGAFPRLLRPLRRLIDHDAPAAEANDRRGARRNIARHYDLSNEMFASFLDESLTYSAALFDHAEEDLTQAQHRKIDRLLEKAHVGPGTRLLEIGTGWGELAIRAARRGATVTTLTLSEAQAALARQRIATEGLSGHVEVRVEDYRDIVGTFDSVVSVEMIEAVGRRHWPLYFHTIRQRLRPGGRVGLQAITMDHQSMHATSRSWTWTQKYIFPGGLIPSEVAIEASLAGTDLRIVDRLFFGDSYAQTLARWRTRFNQVEAEIAGLGFDATFRRMWNFYLAQSEAGFRARYLDVGQLILERG